MKRDALQEKLYAVGGHMVDAFGEGFITSYVYIIIYHSIDMLTKWGNIKKPSCKAQELYNAELNHQLWGHSCLKQSSLDAVQCQHCLLIEKKKVWEGLWKQRRCREERKHQNVRQF